VGGRFSQCASKRAEKSGGKGGHRRVRLAVEKDESGKSKGDLSRGGRSGPFRGHDRGRYKRQRPKVISQIRWPGRPVVTRRPEHKTGQHKKNERGTRLSRGLQPIREWFCQKNCASNCSLGIRAPKGGQLRKKGGIKGRLRRKGKLIRSKQRKDGRETPH